MDETKEKPSSEQAEGGGERPEFEHAGSRLAERVTRFTSLAVGGSLKVCSELLSDVSRTASRVGKKGREGGKDDEARLPLTEPAEVLSEVITGLSRAFGNAVGGTATVAQDALASLTETRGPAQGGTPIVEFGRILYPPPPYHLDHVSLHAFFVSADIAKVQARLDRMFFEPTGGQIRHVALLSRLALFFADVKELRATRDPYRDWGFITEQEVNLWVLTVRIVNPLIAGGLPPVRLMWVPIYTFVDSSMAIAAGREVYGFPKEEARFVEVPRGPDVTGGPVTFDSSLLEMEAFGFPQYNTATIGDWCSLLLVEPTSVGAQETYEPTWSPDGDSESSSESELIEEVFLDLARLLFDQERSSDQFNVFRDFETFVGFLSIGRVPMAFLKQFERASDGSRSCYQAVVEADMEVRRIRGGGFTSTEFKGKLLSIASHPFKKELGIEPSEEELGSALWLDLDLRLAMGRALWCAPIHDEQAE